MAGAVLIHRTERRVEIVEAGDPVGERYGTPLCPEHLARTSAPSGWELLDRRVASDEPAGRTGQDPTWTPGRVRDDPLPDTVASARSPLLRRAFLGADDGSSHAGLTRLERVHAQIDRDPERLGRRVEYDGEHHRHEEGGDQERHRFDVGPHERDPTEQGEQQQHEGDDRARADGADEMAGSTLEAEAAVGTRLAQHEPSPSESPAAAHGTGPRGAAPQHGPAAGGGDDAHADEPTVHQLQLAV
jgi:hypothetical protein